MIERVENDGLFRELALVGKAFASEKRLRLLGVMAQGERTVEGLARTVGLGVTTVSSHLQILRSSGLVTTRREGTRVYYRLSGDDVAALFVAFRSVAATRSANVERELAILFASHGADTVEVITRDELRTIPTEGLAVIDVRLILAAVRKGPKDFKPFQPRRERPQAPIAPAQSGGDAG